MTFDTIVRASSMLAGSTCRVFDKNGRCRSQDLFCVRPGLSSWLTGCLERACAMLTLASHRRNSLGALGWRVSARDCRVRPIPACCS